MKFLQFDLTIDFIVIIVVSAIASICLALILKVHAKQNILFDSDDIITATAKHRSEKIRLAGVKMTLRQYYGILAGAAAILFYVAYTSTGNVMFGIIVGALGGLVPNFIVNILQNKANKAFSEHYQKALEQMSSSLKAGNSFKNAVKDVVHCQFIHSSMRKYFEKIDAELEMGISVTEAFAEMAEETGNHYVKETAVAIDVQGTVGNKEDVVIKNIATSIQDEMALHKKIDTAFATTTSMVRIMDFFPPLALIYFTITNRSYIDVYFSSRLMTLVYIALFVIPIIGSVITHKMLKDVRRQI